MKTKTILTSIIAMTVGAPAFAERTIVPYDEFPDYTQGEYLQENTEYQEAANETNLDSVTDDGATVFAVSQWDFLPQDIPAGFYAPANYNPLNDNGFTECPGGYYCPGMVAADLNLGVQQGLFKCRDIDNHSYDYSKHGSTSESDCFRLMSGSDVSDEVRSNLGEPDISSIFGEVYYNGDKSYYVSACNTGYHTTGDFREIGDARTTNVHRDGTGQSISVTFDDYGTVTGRARCSSKGGEQFVTQTNSLPSDTGKNCWCILDEWTPNGGYTYKIKGSLWMLGFVDNENCETDCDMMCNTMISQNLTARQHVFASLDQTYVGTRCAGNTININWGDGVVVDDDAATCTYGGSIKTPTSQPVAPSDGLRFKGWRLQATNPNATPVEQE